MKRRHAAGPHRVSPFLTWGDFHARSRFARSTISEEKWGTTLVYHLHISHNVPYLPPKFCITFGFFYFCWVLQPSQEKLKTMHTTIFFWGGGGQIRRIVGDVKVAYFKTLVMQRHKNNLLHMLSKILCFLQSHTDSPSKCKTIQSFISSLHSHFCVIRDNLPFRCT